MLRPSYSNMQLDNGVTSVTVQHGTAPAGSTAAGQVTPRSPPVTLSPAGSRSPLHMELNISKADRASVASLK